jgi:hypothetical protein
VQIQKKQWVKPEIRTIELDRARHLIAESLRLIEDNAELESERTDLRKILRAIEQLGQR